MLPFPEITVFLSKSHVRLVARRTSLELAPVVYLSATPQRSVVSISEAPTRAAFSEVVDLFDGKEYSGDKSKLLEDFLRIAIDNVLGSGLVLAPKIIFEASPEIVTLFGGYHHFIFSHTAKAIGARQTSYDRNEKGA